MPCYFWKHLVDDLEAELQQRTTREVTSTELGEAVLEQIATY